MKLEFEKIAALAISWTLVHPIDEESPLFKFTKEDFRSSKGEIIVYLKAFDEMFSSQVSVRSSYAFNEIIYGAKFQLMYHTNVDISRTILELNKINSFDRIILD